jgi:hypothetical protein
MRMASGRYVLWAAMFLGCGNELPQAGANGSDAAVDGSGGAEAGELGDASSAATDAAPSPGRDGGGDASDGGAGIAVEVVFSDALHLVRAVDRAGTVYALTLDDLPSHLYASLDGARTFQPRGVHPLGAGFQQVTSLRDGTLLADTVLAGSHSVSRSTDHGVTWLDVLALGAYRWLQPHSVAELGGEVFLGEYQSFTQETPIRLWRSGDGGATWQVRYTFQGSRHAHAIIPDPASGALFALLGDWSGGLLRSFDAGGSWSQVLGVPDGVAVDAVVTQAGLLFGRDALYLPAQPAIVRLTSDGTETVLASLPGPSYSIHSLAGGGYLLGETREPAGDVYSQDDLSAHVFGSRDGVVWSHLLAFPRASPLDYVRADIHWLLPSGEVLLELWNTETLAPGGNGFLILRAR